VARTRIPAIVATLALTAAACASGSARTAAPSTTTEPELGAVPIGPVTHVQLPLEDRSRPAVDPIGVRSAPTRHLPTELYLPPGTGRRPLVIFAHGYNGDPGKFTQLLGHWAAAGFVVAAPRFPITYTGAADGPLARAGDIAQQPQDMSFVLDQLLAGKYASRIDRTRIGAAGLSLGGGTTWGLITDRPNRDPRVRAAIVMDGNRFGFGDATYVPNRMPVLVYHADHDYSLPFADAQKAYAQIRPPKYFVTLFETVHAQPYEDDPDPADDMVRQSSVDFWRAYLLGDAKARSEIVATATVAGVSTAQADLGR
jgi:predicted dienelactone hydrolase